MVLVLLGPKSTAAQYSYLLTSDGRDGVLPFLNKIDVDFDKIIIINDGKYTTDTLLPS